MIELHLKISGGKTEVNKCHADEGCLQMDFAIALYLLELYKKDLLNSEFSYEDCKENKDTKNQKESKGEPEVNRGYLG